MKALTKTDLNLPGQVSVYHGKVRDVYNINDDLMVMVATDPALSIMKKMDFTIVISMMSHRLMNIMTSSLQLLMLYLRFAMVR